MYVCIYTWMYIRTAAVAHCAETSGELNERMSSQGAAFFFPCLSLSLSRLEKERKAKAPRPGKRCASDDGGKEWDGMGWD